MGTGELEIRKSPDKEAVEVLMQVWQAMMATLMTLRAPRAQHCDSP